MSKFGASFGGAVSMWNNDTITIFGNTGMNGPLNLVQQFSLNPGSYGWTNLTNWDTTQNIISYSQCPPDGSPPPSAGQYPTYFLWSHMGYPGYLFVSSLTGNQFEKLFNVTIPMNETGQKIVALTSGTLYIYSKSGLRSWSSGKLMDVNTTQPGGWKEFPALVGYNTGFFVHGGMQDGPTMKMSTNDFYFYDGNANTWSPLNSTGIPPASNHTATLSAYFTESGGNPVNPVFVFFTGIPQYSIALYDYRSNMSSIPKTKSMLAAVDMPLTTIVGAQIFIFGGVNQNTSAIMGDLWQFVNEKFCTSVMSCDDCVSYVGCTFCKSGVGAGAPQCVAGNMTHAYITETCGVNSAIISSIETCPEAFPSWAIALIVIGGVILVGGIVFGIMKLRAVKPGYDPV